ncbi:NAD-dependent epimerase/dehydratase family protein [Streptomyces peucetius]|uniref:Thymidine diphospho-4-keto-2,3,6-trideoxyhexulose reductase n=1 Tax=Streptomyces peucetius TaxID=1950 RepID=O33708_STRPE|nr:thymidine diphospho-4-keto-2,3,6-trideoxyhexulose reductase [Streptomyces peucetius]ATW50548.1 NAD-dependent epimerase [Streptomyces peucetius subsp. caesius ATCC 27952]
MRVVVLGATGSVGRQVCAAYQAHGWDVHGVARRPAPHLSGCGFTELDLAAAAPGRIATVLGDLPADVVVNAAGGWGDTEEEMTYSHLRLVRRLVEALALLPFRPRLVHLGSVHEYGPVPAGTLLHEDLLPEPVTPYARVKLETSSAVLTAARAGVLDAVVLRAANMSGPHPPQESFLAALMARISTAFAHGGRLELSVADARRDFIDVRDVAQAVVRAGRAPAVGGLVVNIGRGDAVPIGDLVGWLLEAAAFPEDRVDRREAPVRSKGGDWTRLDIGRARRLLSWAPRIGLRDSVHSMWRTAHGAPA